MMNEKRGREIARERERKGERGREKANKVIISLSYANKYRFGNIVSGEWRGIKYFDNACVDA